MKDRDLISKMRTKSTRKNWCQRYFRNQHHRRPAKTKRGSHRPNVDFRLTTSSDSMKEKRTVSAFLHLSLDAIEYQGLWGCENVVDCLLKFRLCEWIASDLRIEDLNDSFLLQGRNGRRSYTRSP